MQPRIFIYRSRRPNCRSGGSSRRRHSNQWCCCRSLRQQSVQTGQIQPWRSFLGKLEADLQIAAFQIELADIAFFQELDQLLKLFLFFWIHASRLKRAAVLGLRR
jgi:hypothetical protein